MLEKLQLFVDIARAGTISQAAENRGVSQSTLSSQLKAVEEEVGAPLFERYRRGIRLNKLGLKFLDLSEEALRRFAEIQHEASGAAGPLTEPVTVCATPSFNAYFLPSVLASFRKKYPAAATEVVTQQWDEDVIAEVAAKHFEFGIALTHHPINAPLLDTDFAYRIPVYLVCSPHSPLAGKPHIQAADLRDEPVILSTQKKSDYEDQKRFHKKHRLHFAYELSIDSIDAIKAAAAENLGVAFLPRHIVQRELDDNRLVRLELQDVDAHIRISCVRNVERPLSDMATAFIQTTCEVLDRLPMFVRVI